MVAESPQKSHSLTALVQNHVSRKHQTLFLKLCHMPIIRQGHLKNKVTDTLVVKTLFLLVYTWNMGDGYTSEIDVIKVHSVLASNFSTVYHIDWQSLRMKRQKFKVTLRKYINKHSVYYADKFLACSQNCKKGLSAVSCLSIRMEQVSCYWTDYHNILYLSIFWKSPQKIQVSLKPDKYNGWI